MSTSTAKRDKLYLHVFITALLMFGFGCLPAPDPITPLGMKMLGVFLGLIYGWSFSSLAWPSIMGMLALIMTGSISFDQLLSLGFGNTTVVFLLFVFMFTAAIEQEGLTEYLAYWSISRKVLIGRPWVLSFAVLFGAMITSAFTNTFAAILIFWSIFYNICHQVGIKPYEKYPTLMTLGIAIFSILGSCFLPYRTSPLILLGTYASLTGGDGSINFVKFMLYVVPLIFILLVVYLLVCRFIFRVNIQSLKNIDMKFIDENALVLNKRQKIVMGSLVAFIVLAVLQSLLPGDAGLGLLLTRMTTTGIVMLMLVLLLWVKVDGKHLIDISSLAQKGIVWDMMLLFIIIFPLSDLMMGEDTGIRTCLVNLLTPIFSDISPMIFMVAVLALPAILTNFANNIVVAMIFLQIICSIGPSLGIDTYPLVMCLLFLANIAFYTPAASGPAAMVFGNTEWVKAKDIYTSGGLMIVIIDIVVIVVGLVLGNLIF